MGTAESRDTLGNCKGRYLFQYRGGGVALIGVDGSFDGIGKDDVFD